MKIIYEYDLICTFFSMGIEFSSGDLNYSLGRRILQRSLQNLYSPDEDYITSFTRERQQPT